MKRIGYGQVEPNKLSAQKTGQIFASLPLDKNVSVLQNGEFMYYDYANGMVTAGDDNTVAGEPMLVFNEIKIYEEHLSYKDFAMIRVGDNYVTNNAAVGRITSANTDGTVYGDGALNTGAAIVPAHTEYQYRMDGIAPRLLKTNVGDIYTTNMVEEADYAVKDILKLKKTSRNTLELSKTGDIEGVEFQVIQVYTMPDGQEAVKLYRVK